MVTTLLNLAFPLFLAAALLLFFWIIVKRQRARRRYSPITENMLRTPAQKLESDLDALTDKMWLGVNEILLPAVIVFVSQKTSIVAWTLVGLLSAHGAWVLWKTLHKALQLRLAIDGEQYTGLELNYLMRSGAWVFHDIPYQYGNIDHVIVSTGGVFTVETKTHRKPSGERESSRQATVNFDGEVLTFPHFRTVEPQEQARRHAKHVHDSIRRNLGLNVPVTPVVALPGWFVERSARSDVWIINPKRGGALASQVRRNVIPKAQVELIANYIEAVARSVPAGSKKMDPDATKHYDFWNSRRFEERKLG